jgi:hypothetical protein
MCLLLPTLACLTGCENGGHFTLFGYTSRPPFNDSIHSVYVPIATNYTYLRGIEFDLTRAVINELNSRAGAPKIVSDRNLADTELILKVDLNRKSTILSNQVGLPRDVEIGFKIDVVWRDLRPGHQGDILTNPKRFDPNELPLPGDLKPNPPAAVPLSVMPTASYVPELGGSFASAQAEAVRKAARQIVNMMEVWPAPCAN